MTAAAPYPTANSPRLTAQIDAVLAVMDVIAFEPPADAAYAVIRADLEMRGELISANDLLIAAQAVALEMVVVTDNTREFARIAGLKIENWLR